MLWNRDAPSFTNQPDGCLWISNQWFLVFSVTMNLFLASKTRNLGRVKRYRRFDWFAMLISGFRAEYRFSFHSFYILIYITTKINTFRLVSEGIYFISIFNLMPPSVSISLRPVYQQAKYIIHIKKYIKNNKKTIKNNI